MAQPPYYPPQNSGAPQMLPAEEKNWAVACHLSSFCGYVGVPLGHVLGPLIIWLIKKDSSPYLNEIGKEKLNYGISFTLWMIISGILAIFFIGIPLVFGLVIMDIVVSIKAAVGVSNGEIYRYPLTIKFIN